MKISVLTLGCKVNECESRSLVTALRDAGAEVVEDLVPADAYVINTCSVTGEADRKSRQAIGKAARMSPGARIYVCGCSSQRDPSMYEKYPGVVKIMGNGRKTDILRCIMSDITDEKRTDAPEPPRYFEEMPLPAHEKMRVFIKVQDGCNNFCSYCVIPYVRGRSRSRDIASVMKEAEIASRVTKEIVLTGIDVSSYGKDIGSSLRELVLAMGKIPVRKRMSSFECTVINRPLLEALKTSGFCDHFHLSLQSGSDRVLRAMNRHYTTAEYLDIVSLVREYFPDAGITTDVIAGFPSETEEDFADVCEFVRKVRFSDMHVFPYSERKGTRAAGLKQIPMEERRRRAHILLGIRDELKADFLRSCEGKTLSVYFEERGNDGLASGYATNYVRVYAHAQPGEIKDITAGKPFEEGVIENG